MRCCKIPTLKRGTSWGRNCRVRKLSSACRRIGTSTTSEVFPESFTTCSILRPVTRNWRIAFSSCWLRCRCDLTNAGGSTMALGRCSATVYPKGEVPIVQLSIDETQPPSFHHEIGQRLASLREEGVLITGSGNVVHRLHAYAWGRHPQEPYEWTVSFEKRVRELLLAG